MMRALLLILVMTLGPLSAHEGHHHPTTAAIAETGSDDDVIQTHTTLERWIMWLGEFHYATNHFPIALIVMTAIAEFLFWLRQKNIYEYAALFMIIAAAIFVIPNAMLGLALSFAETYKGDQEVYFTVHSFLGYFTSLLTLLTVAIRVSGFRSIYLACLGVLTLSVLVTAAYGGFLSFGTGILDIPL